ncbi:MAG: hypothetical protein CTY29_02655 [Methylobacter sp.]|nr:MAG: hypothetical protein CTY29_02655 [Methylobacter sp.]
MYLGLHITAIIPALNEEQAIGLVVSDLKNLMDKSGLPVIDRIIVGDNGSTDNTAQIAKQAGADVVYEPQKGYGSACLAALGQIQETDIVLFVDGDCSIVVSQTFDLLTAIVEGGDMVIGSRVLGYIEPGAMSWPQKMGNGFVAFAIAKLWRSTLTDLGPFRVIRYPALTNLEMQDKSYGWTVEMQAKALQKGLLVKEVPVDCRVRIGKSKVSGTLRGVIGAAFGMLGMIIRLKFNELKKTGLSKP